jgi:peptide/nickel transport system substrate-binding protein
MKKLIFILIALISLFSLLLISCNEEATPTITAPVATTKAPTATTAPAATTKAPATTTAADAAKYGGTFIRAISSGSSRPLGYPVDADNAATNYSRPALESLVAINLNGDIIPELAVSWDIAADGKSLIIGLRKGVKFHDGSDFNAAVCKWNLDLMITAKKTTDWTSIDVIDDYTIRLNVPQYKNTMLSNLSLGITQQISKASFDKNGIEWAKANPVGTGPFIFVSQERDAKITFKRNPNYWDTGKPYLDGIEFVVIADTTVQKLSFQKGGVHRITASGTTISELQKEGYQMKAQPGGTFALVPDSNNPSSPWANFNVRLAASYAIDRESIAEALGFGYAEPAYQMFPSYEQTAIPNLVKHKFDPVKAKALLKEAGYPEGFKTAMYRASLVPENVGKAVGSMLQAVGINIEINNITAGKYTDLRYSGWNNSLLLHAFNSYSNFVSIEDYFLGIQLPSLKLSTGFKEGLTTAAYTKEPQKELIQNVMRVMYDDVMVIPTIEEVKVTFLGKGVHDPGADTYSLTSWIWKDIWLEPSARK